MASNQNNQLERENREKFQKIESQMNEIQKTDPILAVQLQKMYKFRLMNLNFKRFKCNYCSYQCDNLSNIKLHSCDGLTKDKAVTYVWFTYKQKDNDYEIYPIYFGLGSAVKESLRYLSLPLNYFCHLKLNNNQNYIEKVNQAFEFNSNNIFLTLAYYGTDEEANHLNFIFIKN